MSSKAGCSNVARFFVLVFSLKCVRSQPMISLRMAIAFGKMSLHIPLGQKGQLPEKRRAVGGLLSEENFFLGIFAA